MKPALRPQPGRPAPAPGFRRRVEAFGRALFPAVSTAIIMILAAAPVGLPSTVEAVALPCVFFWSVFRPSAMSPFAVFALGLLQDLLVMAPFGTSILVLLLVHGVAFRFRHFIARQGFPIVWLVFCVFSLGAAALDWVLQALLSLSLPPLAPAGLLSVVAVGFYPVLALGMTRVHRAMRDAEILA